MLLVVINQVGCHLERAIEGNVECQLLGQSSLYLTMGQVTHKFQLRIKDARSVVHRTTNQAGERKHHCVVRLATAKGFILGAACTFVAQQVRISTTQTGRTYCLVSVYTYLIFCRLCKCIEVVIVQPLSVVVLSARNHITHVTTLYGIVTMVYHKLVSLVHVALVVTNRRRGFVVHHQAHALAMCILVQCLHVEVWIGSNEVEDIIFRLSKPVFPAFVPALNQYLVKTMLGCKVDVLLHVFVICTMLAIRFHL